MRKHAVTAVNVRHHITQRCEDFCSLPSLSRFPKVSRRHLSTEAYHWGTAPKDAAARAVTRLWSRLNPVSFLLWGFSPKIYILHLRVESLKGWGTALGQSSILSTAVFWFVLFPPHNLPQSYYMHWTSYLASRLTLGDSLLLSTLRRRWQSLTSALCLLPSHIPSKLIGKTSSLAQLHQFPCPFVFI